MVTPEPPVDIMREWDEIEREERLIRAELNSAPPGHPILGPINSDSEEPELAVLPLIRLSPAKRLQVSDGTVHWPSPFSSMVRVVPPCGHSIWKNPNEWCCD